MTVSETIAALDASIAEDDQALSRLSTPYQARLLSRFNGLDVGTVAYWQKELTYWKNVNRDGRINADDARTARSIEAITICTNELRRLISGR